MKSTVGVPCGTGAGLPFLYTAAQILRVGRSLVFCDSSWYISGTDFLHAEVDTNGTIELSKIAAIWSRKALKALETSALRAFRQLDADSVKIYFPDEIFFDFS